MMTQSRRILRRVRRLQAGFTLIEVMVVCVVIMTMIGLGSAVTTHYLDNITNQTIANNVNSDITAVTQYIKDNNAIITSQATSSTPVTITTSMLQTAKYLSSSLASTDSYGQSYEFLVLQPSANVLQTLMVSTGGSAMTDLNLRRIAQMVGGPGGYILSSASTVAQGSSWGPITLSSYGVSPGAGHLAAALFFSDGSLVSDYVYRNAVSGHPELNTMTTPLVMSAVMTSGTACSTNGAIASDTNGAVLSCQSLVWGYQGSKFWKDPVTNYAALPLLSNNQGDVRETLDTSRTFTWTGATWTALAVDQNGNLTVPGTVTANKVVTPNGNSVQVGSAYLYGDTTNSAIRQAGAFNVQNVAGTAYADVNLGHVNINATATAGAACTPNGSVAQDGTGLLLSCQSGLWKGPSVSSGLLCGFSGGGWDFNGTYEFNSNLCEGYDPSVNCPSGYSQINAGTANTRYFSCMKQ